MLGGHIARIIAKVQTNNLSGSLSKKWRFKGKFQERAPKDHDSTFPMIINGIVSSTHTANPRREHSLSASCMTGPMPD